jgi:IS30 family transposase
MERHYRQISLEERCEIYHLRADGISQNGIAHHLRPAPVYSATIKTLDRGGKIRQLLKRRSQ